MRRIPPGADSECRDLREPRHRGHLSWFAELVGRGCTQHEAARAVGIGASTGERLIEELLAATDASGAPNQALRARGAELALKYEDVLAGELPPVEELLPQGVVLLCPVPPEYEG